MLLDPQQLEHHKKNYTKLTSKQFQNLYNIQEGVVLGKGTYGNVIKVKKTEGQEVAIKQFNCNANKYFRQIINEVDNLKILQHPNIARFYDCYIIDDSRFYIVIEYCSGGSLTDFLKNNCLSEYDQVLLCKNIADGLACAHQMKVVHRDLKPQNILIGKNNIAKICDFGCSTSLNDIEGSEKMMRSYLGTPAYMDRRITFGQPYNMSVDIYAMGMIFYYIFKGQGIYDSCNSVPQLQRMRSGINANYQENIDELMSGIPTLIRKIIKNCLQASHQKRYTASQISTFFQSEIGSNKSILSKLLSTMDEEEIEDESSLFAIKLVHYYKNVDNLQEGLASKRKVFELLNGYSQNFNKLTVLEGLNFIEPRTKEQFITFVLFYYFHWLDKLQLYLNGEPSPDLSIKYPEIKPSSIEEGVLYRVIQTISSQRDKYHTFFSNCCRKQKNKLNLLNPKEYLPRNYKAMVRAVGSSGIKDVELNNYDHNQLRQDLLIFFQKRMKTEFTINLGKRQAPQSFKDLGVVQSIGQYL